MENFKNLYEVTKTVRFELKPSKKTFKKIKGNDLFKSLSFQSKIFTKKTQIDGIDEAEKKVKNYLFDINEIELNNLVERCDEKIEEVKKVKDFLENNPDKLWEVWIDPEKIKIIDKDLKYILQEKKHWPKSFWNENLEKQRTATVEWKKGLFLTLDDIDAYYEKERSAQESKRKTGEFTLEVLERLNFLLKQYQIRRFQLLLNTAGNTDQNEKKLFQTKKERIARIRNFLEIFLKLEIACSLFNYKYSGFGKFPEELRNIFEGYNNNLQEIIKGIEMIFKESNLYLHKNIARKFSLNICAINPRPENISKTTNQVKTENEIQEEIEKKEEKISDLKNEKAKLKGERKEEKNNGVADWKEYKKQDWDDILKKLNPSNEDGLFSQLTELRRDLEEVHLTHFGVLLEKDGLFYLVLENKRKNNEKNGDIKKIIEFKLKKLLSQNLENNQNGDVKILFYNILTFKALRRLCLEKASSMKTENFLNLNNVGWEEEIKQGRRSRKINRNWREEKYFNNLKIYLQKILKENSEKVGIKFTEKDFEKWENIKWDENLKNLTTIIDKQGHKARWKSFNWDELKKLEENSDIEIFQIYNKDFLIDEDFVITDADKEKFERIEYVKRQLKEKGEEFVPKYKDRHRKYKQNLYTIYWQDFFADKTNEKFRIKPEGKFYVRLSSEDQEENGTKKLIGKDTKKEFEKTRRMRFIDNKILADFNLCINPSIDKVKSKAKTKEAEQHIDEINKIHNNDKTDFYVLGLDRGLNSLVSYGLFDSKGNIVQIDRHGNFYKTQDKKYNSEMDFICGDWSFANSKGEFAKRENCKFNNRKGLKDFTIFIFRQLKMFYEFEKNNNFGIDEYAKQFEKDNFGNKYLEYGNDRKKIRLYILEKRNKDGKSFEIKDVERIIIKGTDNKLLLDESGKKQFKEVENEIWIVDKSGNKVFDYVLSFYVEIAKRIFALKKQQEFDSNFKYSKKDLEELLFESVNELKEGFTNFVVGEIVKLSRRVAKQKNKKLYIVLEDLSNYGKGDKSFTEINHERNISVIVYQKLENNLVKKFNFLQTKNNESEINKTQFSPKIQRIEDIKEFQKKDNKGGQLGNLIFVDPKNTSNQCPTCGFVDPKNRKHKNPLLDYIICKNENCDFSTKENGDKKGYDFIDGGDTLATYNIAKRGLEFINRNSP